MIHYIQLWQALILDLSLSFDNAALIVAVAMKVSPHNRFKTIGLGVLGSLLMRAVLLIVGNEIATYIIPYTILQIVGVLFLAIIEYELIREIFRTPRIPTGIDAPVEAELKPFKILWFSVRSIRFQQNSVLMTALYMACVDASSSLDNVAGVLAVVGPHNLGTAIVAVAISIAMVAMGCAVLSTVSSSRWFKRLVASVLMHPIAVISFSIVSAFYALPILLKERAPLALPILAMLIFLTQELRLWRRRRNKKS
jgi:predicted tellurium resistance membrane protein TerC